MPTITAEQMQLKREALHLLEENLIFQLLLTKLQARQNSKRAEQREAAFKDKPYEAFGCEWAIWGLEQTKEIIDQIRKETQYRPEMTVKY